jgi:hypothetical protein
MIWQGPRGTAVTAPVPSHCRAEGNARIAGSLPRVFRAAGPAAIIKPKRCLTPVSLIPRGHHDPLCMGAADRSRCRRFADRGRTGFDDPYDCI